MRFTSCFCYQKHGELLPRLFTLTSDKNQLRFIFCGTICQKKDYARLNSLYIAAKTTKLCNYNFLPGYYPAFSLEEPGLSSYPKNIITQRISGEQVEELQAAVIDTNEAVELNLQNATPGNRALAISFAREFDSLDDETSRKIFEILKRRKGD